MIKTFDQIGREVSFSFPPNKIISLVPSQTELLFDLGLEKKVIGVTRFCIHPKEKVKSTIKIGGTKKFNYDKIRELNPDLIIGNKEENYLEGINKLASEFPIWVSDIKTIPDALQMILEVGKLTGTVAKAAELKSQIESGFSRLGKMTFGRVAYLIWNKPLMAAGKNTFIDQMLEVAGFRNAFGHLDRYPIVSEQELEAAAPDYIFLSTEPYPFKEREVISFQKVYPKAKIKLVDGEIFSWFGSRMLKAEEYFNNIRSELKSG